MHGNTIIRIDMNGKSAALILTAALALTSCAGSGDDFWKVENGRFCRGSRPSCFIGTNMWYGPLLLSDTEAAAPERLYAELDSLKLLGITNLRVLAGAEGKDGIAYRVEPVLQPEPGVFDEKVFVGLDRFLVELGKRDMSAVIYLTNAWDWSGGFGQYLEWAGVEDVLDANTSSWDDYCRSASRFMTNEKAKAVAAETMRTIVSRVNTVTGKPYKDDTAIFSWQLCNEPRCFSRTDTVKAAFAGWCHEMAALVKSIDPNHMVSAGSEGLYGCEVDEKLMLDIHSCKDIDYLTVHVWPFNWSWAHAETLEQDMRNAIEKTDWYIDEHVKAAEKLGKPFVIEEFGFPRDGFRFAKGSPVTLRDMYYSHVLGRLEKSAKENGALSGVNFWAWGGLAGQSADNVYWHRGDEYCGDPAQEQQGLNSVYLSDSTTVKLLRDACRRLKDAENKI